VIAAEETPDGERPQKPAVYKKAQTATEEMFEGGNAD
jgi:hypothetical protein